MASSLQPPQDDAAIVGAVRLLSVLIAALAMDLAGRKVLLFVSGELHPLLQQLLCVVPFEVGAVWLGLQEAWVRPALVAPASPAPGAGPGTPAAPERSAGAPGNEQAHCHGMVGVPEAQTQLEWEPAP